MNRKKGRDATVDINDSNIGDPVKIFIIQVAALSWAATQVPEITEAIQSFLNVGFRSAAQVEFVVMIGDEVPHPVTIAESLEMPICVKRLNPDKGTKSEMGSFRTTELCLRGTPNYTAPGVRSWAVWATSSDRAT